MARTEDTQACSTDTNRNYSWGMDRTSAAAVRSNCTYTPNSPRSMRLTAWAAASLASNTRTWGHTPTHWREVAHRERAPQSPHRVEGRIYFSLPLFVYLAAKDVPAAV